MIQINLFLPVERNAKSAALSFLSKQIQDSLGCYDAVQLFISIATVKVHAGNIYGKLGVSNRMTAVAQAQKLNML